MQLVFYLGVKELFRSLGDLLGVKELGSEGVKTIVFVYYGGRGR
jgi:hypothetical protein